MTARVAAFDVDGTITDRDCVVPFIRRIGGTGTLAARFLTGAHHVLPALARRDRDRLKAIAAQLAFAGRDAAAVRDEGERFAAEVASRRLRPDTVAHLAAHRRNGDVVVFVSASFEVYLEPLAAQLGGAAVLGTRLCVDGAGRLTGELDGPNCRGPEKVRRLHAWLDEHHGGRSAVRLTAYGDSAGDRELLLDADDARWVGRRSRPAWLPV